MRKTQNTKIYIKLLLIIYYRNGTSNVNDLRLIARMMFSFSFLLKINPYKPICWMTFNLFISSKMNEQNHANFDTKKVKLDSVTKLNCTWNDIEYRKSMSKIVYSFECCQLLWLLFSFRFLSPSPNEFFRQTFCSSDPPTSCAIRISMRLAFAWTSVLFLFFHIQ